MDVIGDCLLFLSIVFFSFTFFIYLLGHQFRHFSKISSFFLSLSVVLNWSVYVYFAYLMVSHQFQFDYVYQHTNLSMPGSLLLASSWAGQAGSLILWSVFCCLPLLYANRKPDWKKRVLPILLFHQLVILLLIVGAKPFVQSAILFQDGLGMNPTLSHLLMVIHPPIAFFGYSFLSLLYAVSIDSLLTKRFTEWLPSAKKFAIIALAALTITTLLGSLWAYQVVGWGGYWSFDPIENGTLITCLLLVAWIHSLSCYYKQKLGLRFIYLLSILIYSSIVHMVLLIRSGLLANLTQHSYHGSGLLYALLFSDVLTFVLPVTLLFIRSSHIKPLSSPTPILSKTGRIKIVIWLLVFMAGILFLDLNQPIVTNYLSLPATLFSRYFRLVFVATSLVAYLFLSLSSSPFAHLRSIRFHAIGKLLLQILGASLISLLLLLNFRLGITSQTIQLFFLLLIPITGVLKTIYKMQNVPWYSSGKSFIHLSVCFLLISFLLTNIQILTERVCLEKNVPYVNQAFSLTLLEDDKTIPQYVGEKRVFSVQINRGPYQFTSSPSIWTYQRKKGKESQSVPSIQVLPDLDFILVPLHNGAKTLQLQQTTTIHDHLITLEDYSQQTDETGAKTEKVLLTIQKNTNQEEENQSLLNENITLTRKITQQGIPVGYASAKSILLNETMEWVRTENEKTITISTPSLSKTHEFEIHLKPYMLLLRTSYLLLGLSLLWYVLLSLLESRIKANSRKKTSNLSITRPHHTVHHH